MTVVSLTVLMFGGTWCVKIVDRLGTRFLGSSKDRGEIEALALQLAEEAWASGQQFDLKLAHPALPTEMTAAA